MAKPKKTTVTLAVAGLGLVACMGVGSFFLGKTAAQNQVPTWEETGLLYATFLEQQDGHTLLVQGSSVNREDQRGQYLLKVDGETQVEINGMEWELEDMFPGMRLSVIYTGEIQEGSPGKIPQVLAIELQGNLTADGHWSYEEELS